MIKIQGKFYHDDYTVRNCELCFDSIKEFKSWVYDNCKRGSTKYNQGYITLYYQGDDPTDEVYQFELLLQDSSRYNPFHGCCNLWIYNIELNGKIIMSTGHRTDGIKFFREKALEIHNELNAPAQHSDFNFDV